MKLAWLVIAVAACSGRDALLADDVAMFCGAWEANGRPERISDLSQYIATRIQSTELRDAFAHTGPGDDPSHLLRSLHSIVDRIGVKSCPTLDWMDRTYPPRRPVAQEASELVLTLSATGGVTASDRGAPAQTTGDADLELRLRATAMRDPETELSIVADPAVPVQSLVALLEAGKNVGLARLAFGTDAAHLIRLARARATSGASTAPNLVIDIGPKGEVVVGGKVVADTELDALLRAAAARDLHTELVASVDPKARVGDVVGVLGRGQRAGLTNFALGSRTAP